MAIIVYNTLPSAARTVTGSVDMGAVPAEFTEVAIYIDNTAVSGTTPSMTVTYQTSPDGVTFFDHTAGAALSTVAKQVIRVTNTIGRYGRISFAVSGTTPSFTFSATSEFKRP